ncbi:MAG TPA: hypothetical protein VN776_06610 [Terracidiphilus sp.]|nr:hypothetical protein [Terracidiphilus sp.]
MHATASMLTEAYSSPLSSPLVYEAPAIAKEMDRVHGSDVPDGSAVKGLMVAIGMEAAAALLVCVTWAAWHFIR